MAEIFNDLKSVLDAMNKVNSANTHNVFCPSIQREVSFMEMNTKHHKSIVSSFISNPYLQLQFETVMYDIIKSTCVEPEIVDSLNHLDKTLIILSFRSWNKSDTYKFSGDYGEHDISISDHLSKMKDIVVPPAKILELDGYTVTLNFPTMLKEYNYDKFTLENSRKYEDEDDPKKLKPLVSTMYILAAFKYIEEIMINGVPVNMSSRSISDQIKIGESLPSQIISDTVKAIDEVFGETILTARKVDFTVKEGKTKTKQHEYLPVDNTLFL